MIARYLLTVLFFAALAVGATEKELIYSCTFLPEERGRWTPESHLRFEPHGDGFAAVIEVKPGEDWKDKIAASHFSLDLKPYAGRDLLITANIRITDIPVPEKAWLGGKFQSSYRINGMGSWPGKSFHGTFDWTPVEYMFTAPAAADGNHAHPMFGLERTPGKIEITDFRIYALKSKATPVPAGFKAEYSDKVKNMPPLRGVMGPGRFRENDFADMQKMNINIVRWQFGEATRKLWHDPAEFDAFIDRKLDELALALDAGERYGIKLVIDPHTVPGGTQPDRHLNMLTNRKYADAFVAMWEKIARRFKGHPALWAYDLVNEPHQTTPGLYDALSIQERALKAIREIDPDTPIMIASAQTGVVESFAVLEPLPYPNLIYQGHMYTPGNFTHQLVNTPPGLVKESLQKIAYPGKISGQEWNRETVRKALQPVRDFQLKYNARIYIGEFSAPIWGPGTEHYLADCIAIFDEYGWDWSYHAFREWPGWSFEHEGDSPHDMRPSTDNPRKRVMLEAFQKNKKR